jgi:hypothetical protein
MIDRRPSPPLTARGPTKRQARRAAIVDVRKKFDRKAPQTAEDRARARAFIEGKMEMLRRDPNLTDAEKAAAISELAGKL